MFEGTQILSFKIQKQWQKYFEVTALHQVK